MSTRPDVRTEQGFIAWLQSNDPAGFALAVADLNEADRKRLSKCAQAHAKQTRQTVREGRSVRGLTPQEMMRRSQLIFQNQANSDRMMAMAHIGLLAVGPKSSIMWQLPNTRDLSTRWREWNAPSPHEQAAIDVLLTRKPEWTQEWLERQLAPSNTIAAISWTSVKRLFDSELCCKPDSQDFAQFMAQVMRLSSLEEDPKLIEMVWDQFRYRTGFWTANGPFRKFPDGIPPNTWLSGPEKVYRLVVKGMVDRSAVINHFLEALWRDFNALERSGLISLHHALDVTADEIIANQNEYCRLLSHEASNVVSFALKCIKSVKSHQALDIDQTIESLAATMTVRSKSQPIQSIGFLKSLAGSNSSRIAKSIRIVSTALQHPESDVQTAALDLLEKWSKSTELPGDLLNQASAGISPVIKPRLESLLARTRPGNETRTSDNELIADDALTMPMDSQSHRQLPSANGDEAVIEQLRVAITSLPDGVSLPLRLSESLQSAIDGKTLPEIHWTQLPFATKSLNEVAPIREPEELIDTVNALIEKVDNPIDVERVLDAIQVIGRDYPADFDLRVAPILARLDGEMTVWTQQFAIMAFPRLFRLLARWMQRGKGNGPGRIESMIAKQKGGRRSVLAIFDERFIEIESRLSDSSSSTRSGLPLLALPSYEHGWIEPAHLLKRLQAYAARNAEVPLREFEIAILRLIPGSTFAQSEIADLPESIQRILLYVSGEPPKFCTPNSGSKWNWIVSFGTPTAIDASPAQFWLAAGRTQNPSGSLSELAALPIPRIAFGVEAANVDWTLDNSSSAQDSIRNELHKLRTKHDASELAQLLDPNQPGLSPDEIARRTQLKSALHGRDSRTGRVIEFKPSEAKEGSANFIPIVLAQRTRAQHYEFVPIWGEHWLATLWPGNCDGAYAHAVTEMLAKYDANASSLDAYPGSLWPLLWTERAWSELAMRTIWLAAMCKSSDVSAIAKDALIEGMLDGRADPCLLSRQLIPLLTHSWFKLNRLADALGEVSHVSLWTTLVVAEILDQVIQVWNEVPRDGHQLLALFLECLAKLDGSPSPVAMNSLRQQKSTGKAQKLIAALLALPSKPVSKLRTAALLEGVNARAQRALLVGRPS